MPETKVCMRCGEEKPLEEFTKELRALSGYTQPCKECRAAYKRNKYRTDPALREYHLEHAKRQWREDPMYALKKSHLKAQARRRKRMEKRRQEAGE